MYFVIAKIRSRYYVISQPVADESDAKNAAKELITTLQPLYGMPRLLKSVFLTVFIFVSQRFRLSMTLVF